MNIILGFGKTETDYEDAIGAEFVEFASNLYTEMKLNYVTQEFANEIDKWLIAKGAESQIRADAHDNNKSSPPERYSSWWSSVTRNPSYVVAIFRFLHRNRKHPASPDGWASLGLQRMFLFDCEEARSK